MLALRWVMLSLVSILLALVLEAVGVPAAFMIGAMVSGIFFVVIGFGLVLGKRYSNLAQAVIGTFIGSALHPEFIEAQNVPFHIFVLVTLSVLGLSIFTGVLVTRIKFLPGSTGLWGTLPGAAPMMIILSEQYGADSRLVAFIQYSRVVLVALIASFVVGNFQTASSPEPWFDINDSGQLAPVAVVVASMILASIMRSPAANFVGAIAIAAIAQFVFKVSMVPPKWLLTLGFVFLGWSVGLRFSEDVRHAAKKAFLRVILLLLAMIACCYLVGCLLVQFFGVDPLTAYLATSPGGVDSIAIIAHETSVDMSFVIAMQMTRFIILLFFGPAITRFVFERLVKSRVATAQ